MSDIGYRISGIGYRISGIGHRWLLVLRPQSLRVEDAPERIETRFSNGFGKSWVRVNRKIDLLDGELVLARDSDLVQQLCRMRSDYVGTENLTVLRVANDLDETFCFA